MKCMIDGCDRLVKSKMLCQMHYFRQRRYGTFELVRKPRKPFRVTDGGYIAVFDPNHPLAMKNGEVFEHRKIMYAMYGDSLPPCEVCGKKSNWCTSHIDHRDRNKSNNDAENLRPLCPGCNTWRDMPAQHTFKNKTHALKFEGKTDTPQGWARDPRVKVSGRTIVLRKLAGMTDEDALFSPKKTHKKLRA